MPTKKPDPARMRSPKWGARKLKCHVSSILRRIHSGLLPAIRLPGGRAWKFKEADFWAMLEQAERPAQIPTRTQASASHEAAAEALRRLGIG